MRSADILILLGALGVAVFIVKMAKDATTTAAAAKVSTNGLPGVLTGEQIGEHLNELLTNGYEYT